MAKDKTSVTPSQMSTGLSAAASVSEKNWPAEATDAVVKYVGQVREKTTGPALTISRGVVYGTVAGVLALVALVLLTIMSVRLIVVALPDDLAYVAHLSIGAVFTLVGAFLWTKRS